MALVCTAAPASNLLSTVTRVKAELSITDTSSDDLLTDILLRASSAITVECGRTSFGMGTYTETLAGTGSQLLAVTNAPILAVLALYQEDELLPAIDPTNPLDANRDNGYYMEDAEAGAIYRPVGWPRVATSQAWGWAAVASQYILPRATSTQRYTVTYTAGYLMPELVDYTRYDPTAGKNPSVRADPPPLPGAVEQACLVTCKAWWYARQRDVTVSRERTLDQDVTYVLTQQGALPATALGLLRDYRRVG